MDKKYVLQGISDQKKRQDVSQKIVTYEEFIDKYKSSLTEGWVEADKKDKIHQEEVAEAVKQFRNQIDQSASARDTSDKYIQQITDPKNDTLYRSRLVFEIPQISIVKDQLVQMIGDPNVPNEVQESCVRCLRNTPEILNENDIKKFIHLTQSTEASNGIKYTLIELLSKITDSNISSILSEIARDEDMDIQIRNEALARVEATEQSVDLFLDFLRHGSEQEQKIAMKRLTEVPLFDLNSNILQAVNEFSQANKRADTRFYLDLFF